MEVNLKLEKLDAAEINTTEYQQLIGLLMYGFIGTRFDIAHDVGKLSRHNHTWQSTPYRCETSRVFRYRSHHAADSYSLAHTD